MKWYYLLASLPPLTPALGSEPPIIFSDFWNKVKQESESIRELAQAILLIKDIENIEQCYHNQKPTIQGTIPLEILPRVISDSTTRSWYLPESIPLSDTWQEKTWQEYYQYAGDIARKYNSALAAWLDWEIALRQVFFKMRCEEQGKRQQVAFSLECEILPEHQRLVDAYYKTINPWEAEQLIDKARWEKIASLTIPYSFEQDEVIVYALHLMILERWWSIAQSEDDILEKVANG